MLNLIKKIFHRFIKIVSKFKEAEICFNFPPRTDLIVYDDVSIHDMKNIVKDYNYFVLQTRYENVTKIYLNFTILIYIFLNFRGNIWLAYLITIIKLTKAKVVITFIDNSFSFFYVSKTLKKKKIKFYAIQNGARYDLNRFNHQFQKRIIKKDLLKNFFIPNFFCFGNYEIDNYKKFQIKVENFYPVGSLRLANYLEENSLNSLISQPKLYDILVISDAILEGSNKHFGVDDAEYAAQKFTKFTIKYAIENHKKILFSLKRLNGFQKDLDLEIDFYKKNLSTDEFNFLISNSTLNYNRDKYLSYNLMLKSEITLSIFSTMLRENLSLGRKSASVNFMKSDIFDFPLEGDCKIIDCNYEEYGAKLDYLLKLDIKNFQDQSNHMKYLMNFSTNSSTIDLIKQQINKNL